MSLINTTFLSKNSKSTQPSPPPFLCVSIDSKPRPQKLQQYVQQVTASVKQCQRMTTTLLLHPKMWQLPPLTKVTHKTPSLAKSEQKNGLSGQSFEIKKLCWYFMFQITCKTITSKQQFNTILIKSLQEIPNHQILVPAKVLYLQLLPLH